MNNSETIQPVCDIRANNRITEQYNIAKLVAAGVPRVVGR
jgi:hypothetical protein